MDRSEILQEPTFQEDTIKKMEHSQTSHRTNHVSSVLLYGIPIVSLFIESQERLCLAQISNTLLKQFSYNEIHNRRVALGITCVQCTPVQLEILRRAGAMPVSSRRCGMITRREAERLCKSFLGDNSPPQLPDDFAFNVQHKCAWGCRGSFLPSRYNSSRAKCIKCSYCGMFFSPNKFIFHSHRITSNDRYVQPDAANFNSWRRHMTLSGNSHNEKIVHAWEDVKAMFNGGTRKRLISNNGHFNNRNQSSPSSISPDNSVGGENSGKSLMYFDKETQNISTEKCALPENSHDRQYNYSTMAAAAAVVGVTAVAAATVGVPFNLQRSSVLAPLHSLRNEQELSLYMWQQKEPRKYQNFSKKIKVDNQNETRAGLVACQKSWVTSDVNISIPTVCLSDKQSFNVKNESAAPRVGKISDYNIPSILSCSAFKPVVASAAILSTSLYTSSDLSRNIYIHPPQSTQTSTVLAQANVTPAKDSQKTAEAPEECAINLDTVKFKNEVNQLNCLTGVSCAGQNIKEKPATTAFINRNASESDDDDEVVDIETTDEDGRPSLEELSILSQNTSTINDIDADVDVDVDGFPTDSEDQFEVELCQGEDFSKPLHKNIEFVCDDFKNNEEKDDLDRHSKTKTHRKNSKTIIEGSVSKTTNSKLIKDTFYSKSMTIKDQECSLKIKQQVAFSNFTNTQHHSIRPLHNYETLISSKSLTESQKWIYPVSNVGPLCYYDSSANEACVDFK
nr:uncharacterized protein LOC108124890 isoform X1 [Drosophila bipectinata]XP_043069377.1 uncharacterized protein LOC108124890 isoform X1 [Drosophila bipectinata]